MKDNKIIAVLGLWHLGLVTAVGLAELGHQVIGFDYDRDKIKELQKGKPTILEPNLEIFLRKNLKSKKLRFTSNFGDFKKANIFYFTFDTPLNEKDEVDLSSLFKTAKGSTHLMESNSLVIVSSQVPIGTTEKLLAVIDPSGKKNIDITYLPENLQLGKAWQRFFHPAMIVIGTAKEKTYEKIKAIYQKVKSPKIHVTVKTAEMVKHAINAYLATSISFANEMAGIADKTGADFYEVAKILKMDERIGPYARVNPGLGFAGGTLARDLKILKTLGEQYQVPTNLVEAVLAVNKKQEAWVVNSLKRFKNKTVGILGLTYTSGTSTLRRSLAVETIKNLMKSGRKVKAYDPGVDRSELASYNLSVCSSIENLARNCDALVLMTEWPEFLKIDWPKVKNLMRQPIILDPNNFLANLGLDKLGFTYIGFGRGTPYEKI
ncbi:nucleotide sugar dehydrogenase [Candidatus Gottesmanbacteria bacterium]|nr:nucleotide sugar dehydrogenase [Candidatus Gottesmanbacteria bacterium]